MRFAASAPAELPALALSLILALPALTAQPLARRGLRLTTPRRTSLRISHAEPAR
jgi:hypothetical protein